MDFLLGEIQRSLVVCPTRVDNHAMQSTAFFNDAIDGGSDGSLLCDIGLNGLELPRPSLLSGSKLLSGLGVVDRVDESSVVVEAGLCDTETDAPVGTRDCWQVPLAVAQRVLRGGGHTSDDLAGQGDLGLVLLGSRRGWGRRGRLLG